MNVREKKQTYMLCTHDGHVTTYTLRPLSENHVSRLYRLSSALSLSAGIGMSGTLIHAQANAYTWTCSHSYVGCVSSRRRRRRRRKQSEEVGREQWRNRGMYSGSRI